MCVRLQSVFEGLEDAGIPLHEIYRTRTGVFVAAYTAFLPAADAPDESLLRAQIMSSLADQARTTHAHAHTLIHTLSVTHTASPTARCTLPNDEADHGGQKACPLHSAFCIARG